MLKQQILGTINISLPLIVLFQFYPDLFFMWQGKIVLSLLLGTYLGYLNRNQMNSTLSSLLYVPTAEHKDTLEKMVSGCGLNPADIPLRYAYTQEQIAMALNNTVVIDPVVWQGYENDTAAQQVLTIYTQHIACTLTEHARTRIALYKPILTMDAQNFIFKHELGHIYNNYAHKKLAVIWVVGTCAVYAGITAAMSGYASSGFLAVIEGIIIGTATDLFLTYLSNIIFKLPQEKQADMFAVQHSSLQEIEAAATFFEKHQDIFDTYKDTLLAYLPTVILTGHMNGKTRAQWLRNKALNV